MYVSYFSKERVPPKGSRPARGCFPEKKKKKKKKKNYNKEQKIQGKVTATHGHTHTRKNCI